MTGIKTAGDLRGFLAEVLIGIRQGNIDVTEAMAIAKVSAQINQSLATEVNTALQLQKMGKDAPIAGGLLLGNAPDIPEPHVPVLDGGGEWCEQCEMRVAPETAASCKSKFCKVRPADADA